ncbi:MAG: NTP transferase domain-containing protein [Caldilineaceae bacterium]|nr:NTP transferase domain-containing protein [Caldilineaceae bacterium]
MQENFDAIILAGYDADRIDALTEITGEPHKALVPIAGKPMVVHVVEALNASQRIGRVVIVGMSQEDGITFESEVHYLPDSGSLFENTATAFEYLATVQDVGRHALLTSADIPLVTAEMVDWFLNACRPYDHDVYWGLTEKSVMEKTFPNSQRTYAHLVEGSFCNGEFYLGRIEAALRRQELFRDMIANRKNVFRQVRILGFRVMLKFVFRRLTIDDLLGVIRRALQLEGAPVILPFAETGMDIDKPQHLEHVEAYIARYGGESAWHAPDSPAHSPPSSDPNG